MIERSREQKRMEQRNKEIQEVCVVREIAPETGARYHLVYAPRRADLRYRCPCCYYKTLQIRGSYDICPVCFWEDDGQDDMGADIIRGGPNGGLSLAQARQNYRQIGACEERVLELVRPPLPQEL